MTWISFSGAKGLTIQPVAPASLAFRLFRSVAFRGQDHDGRGLDCACARSCLTSVTPSMFGMLMSVMIASTLRARKKGKRLDAVLGFDHFEAGAVQRERDHVPHGPRIVHRQYSLSHSPHSTRSIGWGGPRPQSFLQR